MLHYILTHWQGKLSLPRSVLNALLLYVLMAFGLYVADSLSNSNQVVLKLAIYAFGLWMLGALFGIFRCGTRVALDRGKQTWARIGGTVAIVGVLVATAATINDLIHLGLLNFPKPP